MRLFGGVGVGGGVLIGDQLARTSFHSLCKDRFTVAQQAETTVDERSLTRPTTILREYTRMIFLFVERHCDRPCDTVY